MAAAAGQRRGTAASLLALALGLLAAAQVCGDQNQGAVFLREFTLIRRESLHDDFLSDLLNNHKTEDPTSAIGQFWRQDSEEDLCSDPEDILICSYRIKSAEKILYI